MGHGTDAQLLHSVCWGTDQQLNMGAVVLGPYLQESGRYTGLPSLSLLAVPISLQFLDN